MRLQSYLRRERGSAAADKTNLGMLVKLNFHEIAFVFGAFMMMVFVSSVSVFRIVEKEIARNAESVISTAEAHIYSELREVEISTLNAALILESRLEPSHSEEEVNHILRDLNTGLMRTGENVSGLIFMGGFIDGGFSMGLAWIPGADFIPQDRPWYDAAIKSAGRVAFTGPYIDFRTGKRIVSFSKKLTTKHGKELGVLFLDMDIENIVDYITSQQVAEDGYGMLVGPDAVFVAHPDEAWIGRSIAEVSESYARLAERILAGEEKISSVVLAGAAGSQVVTFLRRTGNGWYIGVATPTYSYYQDVYSMIGLLSLLGFLMMLVLSYFLLRLSRDKLYSEQANIGKSSFLARMSHEIRTPLNSILGVSELIMVRKNVTREVLDYVAMIRQAGNSLLGIINDILDFSKIEAGQMALTTEKYSVTSLINNVVNVIRVRLLEGSVSFFVLVDSDIPESLIGDEVHVRQILTNLLSNAVKYTNKGRITLSMRAQDMGGMWRHLTFSVEDTGLGIRSENLDKLFMDFMRIDAPKSRAVEGTGLGLSIARSLCRAMGGDISVTSRYGHGSEFTATIVQKAGSDKKLASVENPEEKRVVVFEEKSDFLDALVYALTTLGVQPAVARSLDQFKQDLESGRYGFAFVPSTHVMDCIFVLGKSRSPTILVNMAALGEISSYGDISSISMPVYCVGVANVLNGVAENVLEGQKRQMRFMAPDARVLIVDDISTNLRVSKELMALYGMDVHTCLSGPEAIELAQTNRYDIVFMDHMMPGMDGLQAAAAIRALDKRDPYYQNLPIIALTANAIAGQREMFLQNGMNDFLAKPIELQKLDVLLQKWIPAEKQVKEEEPALAMPAEHAFYFEIEGVAVEAGLSNSGGALEAYLDILEDFCRDAEERAGQIEKCAAEGNLPLYMTLVHALKGASRSVGASAFADKAARMEEAAKNKEANVVTSETDSLLAALRELTANIRFALDRRQAAAPQQGTESLSAEQLAALKAALIAMDIHTVNSLLMEYSARSLDKETKNFISEIEHHILVYEYDKAIETIDKGQAPHAEG